ncbi:MAG: acetylxylan esterase, partial [Bacteroidales bacterium]|nr:acetylxylan esterase [Bacteroidales bacterium]
MKKIILLLAGVLVCAASFAQEPVTFTAQQDHQNMMDQLGIKSIRHSFDADQSSPYAANYDESKANPFPVIPELMKTNAGKKVTTAKQWWDVRRPEIVEGFESEVYGRVPANVPKVTWIVEAEEIETLGMMRVKAKQLRGHVDNSACPSINVDIKMVVVTPADAKGPVPVLMMFGGASLPNPVKPGGADMAVINKALRRILENDPETAELMKKYPAWQPFEPANPFAAFARPAQQTPGQDPPSNQQLIAAGWGYAMIDPSSIQADNGAGLTRGIIGLVNKGQPRKPDDWGSLRAWAWGAARGLDYLETDPDVDAKHVGIEGVSRYGKAALVTLAFED